jgi:AraC-like DNA-binding protein
LEALQRLERYIRVLSDKSNVSLQTIGSEVKFVLVNPVTTCPSADEHNDANLALVVKLCRTSFGEDFNPIKVTMMRPIPRELDRYEKCFRVPVEYASAENSIYFRKSDLEKVLPTANTQLAVENDKIIAEYLARYQRSNLTLRVRHKIIEQLASGKVSQESVAEALIISLRNLQRNLQKEGSSYKELLEDVRRELAAQYMEQSEMSINEITFLLGFSEPANFSRAFKRWTGVSPREFRIPFTQQH